PPDPSTRPPCRRSRISTAAVCAARVPARCASTSPANALRCAATISTGFASAASVGRAVRSRRPICRPREPSENPELDQAEFARHLALRDEHAPVTRPRDGGARQKPEGWDTYDLPVDPAPQQQPAIVEHLDVGKLHAICTVHHGYVSALTGTREEGRRSSRCSRSRARASKRVAWLYRVASPRQANV